MSIYRKHPAARRAAAALVIVTVLAVAWGVSRPVGSFAQTKDKRAQQDQVLRGVNALLSSWKLKQAALMLATFAAGLDGHPDYQVARARLLYLRGKFKQANAMVKGLDVTAMSPGARFMVERITTVHRLTRHFKRHTTADGRFVITHPPGADELLVPYAERALKEIYRVVNRTLGVQPSETVHVQLLPSTTNLAAMSSLTDDEVRRTGTIALCLDHRLMLVTPRAMLTGYGWLDTLAHEYVHYVLKIAAPQRVPLWLHEGLARFTQEVWRRPLPTKLTVQQEHLLASALEERRLVPLRRMEPSMAKLKDAREAATAFAQVASMVLYVFLRKKDAGLRKLIAALAADKGIDGALQEVTGVGKDKFLVRWRAWLRGLGLKRRPGVKGHTMRFKKPGKQPSIRTTLSQKTPAQRYGRLGAILRARGHFVAAAVEYVKAHLADKGRDGMLANTLTRLLVRLGRHAAATKVAAASVRYNGELSALRVAAAQAYEGVSRWREAERHYLAAIRVDPFDPAIHCGLGRVYEKLGDLTQAQQEQRVCLRIKRISP